MVMSSLHYNEVTYRCVAVLFYLSQGLVWVCEIEFSDMGKNSVNPDLLINNKEKFSSLFIKKSILQEEYSI